MGDFPLGDAAGHLHHQRSGASQPSVPSARRRLLMSIDKVGARFLRAGDLNRGVVEYETIATAFSTLRSTVSACAHRAGARSATAPTRRFWSLGDDERLWVNAAATSTCSKRNLIEIYSKEALANRRRRRAPRPFP